MRLSSCSSLVKERTVLNTKLILRSTGCKPCLLNTLLLRAVFKMFQLNLLTQRAKKCCHVIYSS